mgnify:CR=1 FL=1
MNDIQVFENKEFGQVRTVVVNNEPWFVGKDVADVLGYSNASKAVIRHVDEEDKKFLMLNIADSQYGNVSPGQSKTAVINESGLYSLILSSKMPKAKQFKHWVTSEVLPTIRKTGGYVHNDDAFIDTYLPFADDQTKLLFRSTLSTVRNLNAKIEQDKPKVLFADAVSASKAPMLIGELAKILKQNGVDTGEKRLFAWLRDNGYLIKRKGTDYNAPTQRSMELGLFEVKETAITHADGHVTINRTTKVTGKGQLYFINKFVGDCKEIV